MISDHFVTNTTGREMATPMYVLLVRGVEVFSIVSTLLIIALYIVKPLVKTGKMSWDGLFFLAVLMLWIQEPWLNYTQHQILYSTVFVNFGSWCGYLPGWNSPNPEIYPVPIIFTSFAYMWILAFPALLFSNFMRWMKARKPGISDLNLIGLTFLTICVFDLVLETFILRTHIFNYGSTVPRLSLFAGKYYQFPIYEMLSWSACYLALACLRFYRDDKGQSFVERGIDHLRAPTRLKTFVRWLAIVGFAQTFMFLSYNVPYAFWGTQSGPIPDDMPAYQTAGLCGPGTDYDCPDFDVPIARKKCPTNRICPEETSKLEGDRDHLAAGEE
ncbi:MAG: spirocyclase AveC family protein [Desulfatitalea sp.]|nr:spirocyclase AveC family protein [Desulfatitalea sp.]NNK02349.1 spirocyclase AveC family protein [Desulfatitalea sp.]